MSNITRREDTALSIKNSLEEQFRLLALFGLPQSAACRYMVKVDVDGRKVLSKREHPIEIFADDEGRMRSIASTNRTGADRVGFNAKRGKYNDEDRLEDGQIYGSQRRIGDVQSWCA